MFFDCPLLYLPYLEVRGIGGSLDIITVATVPRESNPPHHTSSLERVQTTRLPRNAVNSFLSGSEREAESPRCYDDEENPG